jgi:hypothetical protein
VRVRGPLVLLGVACGLLVGCGGKDGAASGPEPKVRIQLQQPADLRSLDAESIEVRGIVSPASATVEVAGKAASVSGGEFSAKAALHEGMNLIDVSAAANGARAAFTVVRVERLVRVTVPRVVGQDHADAGTALRGLGLTVVESRGGGFFDHLLPGGIEVCRQDPGPGRRVAPGTQVELVVARRC